MLDCIVIGAGPSGIVAVKELLECDIENILCLEQTTTIGGVFSRGYDSLTLTSSTTFSMFSDFWIGDHQNDRFWSKNEAVSYWKRYAEYFGVLAKIQFDSPVSRVSRLKSEGWQVEVPGRPPLTCQRLIVAIGNNSQARYPDWHAQLESISYSHSQDYKNAKAFEGKRVLIVGGGESASDVALEVSRVAEKCWVSLRESSGWIVPRKRGVHASDNATHRGVWDLPREYGAELSRSIIAVERSKGEAIFHAVADINSLVKAKNGIWGTYGTKTFSLPEAVAHHGCKIVKGITKVADGGRVLETANGQVLKNVDMVIFCTGYLSRAPFLPKELQNYDPRELYKQMFHPEFGDRLVFAGRARPAFGSQFGVAEMQARFCALVFSGKHALPSSCKMREIAKEDFQKHIEQFEDNAIRIRSLVDHHRFVDDLASIIGCSPPLWSYFFKHPRLWFKMMYGPTQATQFRLRGPGKKIKVAHQILKKLPLSHYGHVVKLGVKGQVIYLFKKLFSFLRFTGKSATRSLRSTAIMIDSKNS